MEAQVKTRCGTLRGRIEDGVRVFKGIPYAAAPEGALRFAAPAPPEPWAGVREAAAFGPAPPQLPPAPGVPPVWRPEDGLDCLRANVWSPDGTGLPVLVWIYGGGWAYGAASMPQYDAAELASHGVVVVTFGYRTGFEGFGHIPGAPANRGLLDQLAALRWVQEEIAVFGGDPGNVTVAGQSAGASSLLLLAGSGKAAGLFHRGIAQSPPRGCRTPEEAATVTTRLAQAVGAAPTARSLADIPAQTLMSVPDAVLTAGTPGGPFGPVLDGDLVTGEPWETITAARDLALVIGSTSEEYLGIGPLPADGTAALADAVQHWGLAPEAGETYLKQAENPAHALAALLSDALIRMPALWTAEAHSTAGGRTWLYDFTWAGPLGAAHGTDVPFVFGLPRTRFAARLLGPTPPPSFQNLSTAMTRAWTEFAATGDPGWPRFEPPSRALRIWDIPSSDTSLPPDGPHHLWHP